MNIQLLLIIIYLAALGIWGYQDIRNIREKGQVDSYSVLVLSTLYLVVYLYAFITSPYSFVAFLAIAALITFGIWVILRKQLAPLDIFALFLGNITSIVIALPAFVVCQVSRKVLITYKIKEGHAFLGIYFICFLVVGFAEGML